MTREVVEYSSADIANQIDRLKAIPWKASKNNSHNIVVVGPWAPEALARVRQDRMQDLLENYQSKISRTGLWTPEEVIRPDELFKSRKILSFRSKVALGVIANTEGEIDAYREAGEMVFTTPAIRQLHKIWADEEERHNIITNFAKEIILGDDSSKVAEMVAQIGEQGGDGWREIVRRIKESQKPRWSHTAHPGLHTEIGHGLYLPEQERLTADADEGVDKLAYIDHYKWGIIDREFGASRLYRVIRPEEIRHSGMGVNRSKIEFSLYPEDTLELYLIVRDGFMMPGENFIQGSKRLAVILYGGRDGYLNKVNNAFDKAAQVIFGLEDPADVVRLAANIRDLNRQLSRPELRVVKKDTTLEEYPNAA